MANWMSLAPWDTALSRCLVMLVVYAEPDGAVIAAIESSQTPVGWFEMRLPPDSAAALADQSGFTYTLAPEYGLSTCASAAAGATSCALAATTVVAPITRTAAPSV